MQPTMHLAVFCILERERRTLRFESRFNRDCRLADALRKSCMFEVSKHIEDSDELDAIDASIRRSFEILVNHIDDAEYIDHIDAMYHQQREMHRNRIDG